MKQSTHTISSVQDELLRHLEALGCNERTLLLSGNSIHADRMFLTLQMPTLTSFLYKAPSQSRGTINWLIFGRHYRQIDVSTIKSLAQNWNTRVSNSVPAKTVGHRAMDDILESIEELRHYRKAWLKSDSIVE